MTDRQPLALFVESPAPLRLAHAASLATSAALLGRSVTLVWMGEALARFVAGRLDEGLDEEGRPSLLLAEARVLGSVTFWACSADARRLGVPRSELLARVDDVLAMTTILRRIEGAQTLYI